MGGMTTKGTSFANMERKPRGFMNHLSSMALEWLLIFLLFVDAAFSYLLTKFARYCKLQTPCLLCSRLDHLFGNDKPDFYRSLLCSNHRKEISSLIACQIHGKLADAHGMCEECLMSFTMQNKPNSESFRLLVGKLGVNLDQSALASPFLNKNINPSSLSSRTCSCCNKIWRARSSAQRMLQLPAVGYGTVKHNIKPPLPRLPGRSRLGRRDSFKKIRDKISGPITPRRLGNTGIDPLSHVGYTELKITSDSESEFPFSDDDDGSSAIRDSTESKRVLAVHHGSGVLPKVHTNKLAAMKQTQQTSDPGPSLLDQSIEPDSNETRDVECLVSDDVMGHSLGELNWEQANSKCISCPVPELISLDDVPPSSNAVEVPAVVSASMPDVPLSHNSSLFALSELISLNDIPPSSSVMGTPVGVSPQKHVSGNSDIAHKTILKYADVSELMTKTTEGVKIDYLLNDNAPITSKDDISEASKSSDTNKERVVPAIVELAVSSDSAKVHGQILNADGNGSALNDMSPRLQLHGNHDELQRSDASNSNKIRVVLQRSSSLEKNDSGYESFDGSSVSEIEGESIVDKLKRQVNYDRRCISALYKELEEERSASEVAANQAMAMITRLQEEKASLHMEALQYLRMMEEQAEYDMEALEKANDLLAEKEKEVQDLEAELESYRINFLDEVTLQNINGETNDSRTDNLKIENNGHLHIKSKANIPRESMSTKMSEACGENNDIRTSLLDFEGEKLYISECLKKLENKLHQVVNNGAPTARTGGGYSNKVAVGVKNPRKSLSNGEVPTDYQKGEDGYLRSKDLSALNGNLHTMEVSDPFVENNGSIIKGNNHFDSGQQMSSINDGDIDLITLENEISDLNGRLDTLEADRDFLEHAFNSLRNGNEGLEFIQEIAHQLQELRKTGIGRRFISIA